MPKVIITDRSGSASEIDIQPGVTLMQTMTDAGISELLALCGGVCSCATCHVYVDNSNGYSEVLAAMSDDEDALLDGSSHRQPNSRLSCQIRLAPELDGLRVTIAPED